MTPIIRTLQLVSLSVLTAVGCASTSNMEEAKPAANPTKATQAAKASKESTQRPVSVPSFEPVYFDTDRAVLRADARTSLEARAEAIRQHPEWGVVTIQGHCDERGSDAYNLALGERRAAAVKRFLVKLGVPASRLVTVSYGESRPAVAGHDETAWRYNRRSELASEAVRSANR